MSLFKAKNTLIGKDSLLVIAICCLVLFLTSGMPMAAFSVYLPFMRSIDGLSNSDCSTVLTARNIAQLVSLLFIDKYIDWLGVRRGISLGSMSTALAFAIFALADSVGVYCFGMIFAGIGYSLSGFVTISILLRAVFKDNSAMALGVCSTGTGFALVIMPSILTVIIQSVSMPVAFLSEAILGAVISLSALILLRNAPCESCVKTEDSDTSERDVASINISLSNEKLRLYKLVYVLIIIAAFGLSASSFGALPNISLLLTEFKLSPQFISLTLTIYGIVLIGSKVAYGYCVSHIGAFKSDLLFYPALILGIVIDCMLPVFSGNTSSIQIASLTSVVLMSIGAAMCTIGLPVLANEITLSSEYNRRIKHVQLSYTIGTIVFSFTSGVIADAFGSFIDAYIIFAIFSALSFVAACSAIFLVSKFIKIKH